MKNETEAKVDKIKSIRKFSDDIYGNKVNDSDKNNRSMDRLNSKIPRNFSLKTIENPETENNIVLSIEEGIQYKIKANKYFKQNNYLEARKYYERVI